MISLITVTYNRAKLLRRGLVTVLTQSILPDEIVVIDDGSSDNTQQVCEEMSNIARREGVALRYFYLNHPEPRISCKPRNFGIKQAKGDVLIFTEPEALHVNNTIEQLMEDMEKYPDNTILASQVWSTQRLISESLTEDYYTEPVRIITHPYAKLVAGNETNDKAPDSDWAITGEANCNAGVLFATRKEWLEAVGGFDEDFKGHGWDDFDLFNRLALYGHGIIKDPNIIVIHQYHDKGFYPYNVYEVAEENGKKSESRIHAREYRANIGKNWGTDEQ